MELEKKINIFIKEHGTVELAMLIAKFAETDSNEAITKVSNIVGKLVRKGRVEWLGGGLLSSSSVRWH